MTFPKPYSISGLGLALIVAFCFLIYMFPLDFVLGSSPYWLVQDQDATQYVTAFKAYLNTPWQLPLLYINGINWPEGTMVTFMDGVPIYAFLIKLLIPLDILTYSPYGFYIALCILLQGTSAWFFVRLWKIDSWVLFFCLIFFLITFPALLFRLGHISLMSHWLILAGLYVYAIGDNNNRIFPIGWAIILFFSFYINIYIFSMVFAVFCADHIRAVSQREKNIAYKFIGAMIPLASSLFIFLLPLPGGGGTTADGFGLYSMNIIEPISGGKYTPWFYERATAGQYEGFNYLGLGLIIISLIALLSCIKDNYLKSSLLRNWPLLIILSLFFIYSLSNNIYFQKSLVLSYEVPEILNRITNTFRASGRFFWTIGYCLIIFSILVFHKKGWGKSAYFKIFLLLLLVLQALDTRPYIKEARAAARGAGNEIVDFDLFDSVVNKETTETIYYYPYFGCEKSYVMHTLMPIMLYSSLSSININTGYIARYSRSCDDVAEEIKNSKPEDSVYIFSKVDYGEGYDFESYLSDSQGFDCSVIMHWYVCKQNELSED
jgi:hypothetical protein